MKVLLLEDEVMLNESICEYLESDGHKIESFFDGFKALVSIKENSYDLMLLDINVPNINGLELLKEMHKLKIYIPTIYISTNVDIEGISCAYDLGCYDYLKKPFHLKELSLRIDRIKIDKEMPRLHLKLSKNYSYDQEHSLLLFNNEPQILTKKQSQIIDLLARNRGMIVDFEQFRIHVWDEQFIDNATIRTEINRLKKILFEDIVINVRGMGYMIDKP